MLSRESINIDRVSFEADGVASLFDCSPLSIVDGSAIVVYD